MIAPKRNLLLIAFHFPPIQGSTGTIRTLAFSRYLPLHNWDVTVLTIRPEAYESAAAENISLIPPCISVERAWGIDAKRHLSIKGRYPRIAALPDRWQSWIPSAILRGSAMIRRSRPDAIMSTYPIASAHLIGYLLHRAHGLPWIAEFRDPMLQPNYPSNAWERASFAKIERLAFERAAEIVVTTEGCRRMYLERFPVPRPRISIVPNGYDPEMFIGLRNVQRPARSNDPYVLLHSGLLYPHERNPTAFFKAVKKLYQRGVLTASDVEFRFRATGYDEMYRQKIADMGIESLVKILPKVPYRQALEEMVQSDALMLFQANNCNDQIPAKLYEYLYCQKPILALTDPQGDTGRLLLEMGLPSIASLEDASGIERLLATFVPGLAAAEGFVIPERDILRFSRKNLTAELHDVLERAVERA